MPWTKTKISKKGWKSSINISMKHTSCKTQMNLKKWAFTIMKALYSFVGLCTINKWSRNGYTARELPNAWHVAFLHANVTNLLWKMAKANWKSFQVDKFWSEGRCQKCENWMQVNKMVRLQGIAGGKCLMQFIFMPVDGVIFSKARSRQY